MSNTDKIIMFLKVHLTEGDEKMHSIELDARCGQETVNLAMKISEGIENMLGKQNTLVIPNPSTIYKSDKVMWVEIGFADRQDLTDILEQQTRQSIGFRTG